MPQLFDPMTLRGRCLSHRGRVAAMRQSSCDAVNAPGAPPDWHWVQLGQFAVGGAVGLITTPAEANALLEAGRADVVLIARAALRDPRWWLRAADELGVDLRWGPQYERAGGY